MCLTRVLCVSLSDCYCYSGQLVWSKPDLHRCTERPQNISRYIWASTCHGCILTIKINYMMKFYRYFLGIDLLDSGTLTNDLITTHSWHFCMWHNVSVQLQYYIWKWTVQEISNHVFHKLQAIEKNWTKTFEIHYHLGLPVLFLHFQIQNKGLVFLDEKSSFSL